jgi:hypothetical protein
MYKYKDWTKINEGVDKDIAAVDLKIATIREQIHEAGHENKKPGLTGDIEALTKEVNSMAQLQNLLKQKIALLNKKNIEVAKLH